MFKTEYSMDDLDELQVKNCLSWKVQKVRIWKPNLFTSGSEQCKKFRICNNGVLDIELPVQLKFGIFFKNNSKY